MAGRGCVVTGPGPVSWAPTAIAAVLMVTDRLSDVKMQGSEGLIGEFTISPIYCI